MWAALLRVEVRYVQTGKNTIILTKKSSLQKWLAGLWPAWALITPVFLLHFTIENLHLFPLCLWQSFSNADLVDEESLLGERSCSTPQWRCYIKYISSQQILLTFLPASFRGTCSLMLYNVASVVLRFSTPFSDCRNVKCGYCVYLADVLMLMSSGLETEPQSHVSTQEDDTLTPSNTSQADFLSGSTSGLDRSESGLSQARKLRRSSSSGHFTARSPVLSTWSEGQTGPADFLDQDSWDSKVSETEIGTPGSGLSNALVKNKKSTVI